MADVVVHDVEDDPEPRVVQAVDHALHLVVLRPAQGVAAVGGLRREEVGRGVTPVVAVGGVEELGRGHELHVRRAHGLDVIDPGARANGGEHALVGAAQVFRNTRGRMLREVAHMGLVHHDILRLRCPPRLISPAGEPLVGLGRVDHDRVVLRMRRGARVGITDLRLGHEALRVAARACDVEGVVGPAVQAGERDLPCPVPILPQRVAFSRRQRDGLLLTALELRRVKQAEMHHRRARREEPVGGQAVFLVEEHAHGFVGGQGVQDRAGG